MAEQSVIPPLAKYLNKKISLLSTSAVRYVGQLNTVDLDEPSISLKNVQCLGTEERRTGQQAIAASNVIYEFIRFRANNIKSLQLEKNNQKIDLNKEILEPLRQHANASQSSQTQPQQQQQQAIKSSDKQRNKPSIIDEPKRKVGVPQQPYYGGPYDYYSSQRSPQYAAINQYEYGPDVYPPIPSPYQAAQEGPYSPNYPYDNDPNYSQNINFSQTAPVQPQSSYYSRDNSQFVPNEYYYQQNQSPNYGIPGPHPAQANVSFGNQSSQRYNRPPNYRQHPSGNYGYYQQYSNANRPRYPNQEQRGRDGMQGKQRYYNPNNQRQGVFSGFNRNRNDAINNNQAPGTGAYLDRRLRGNDLDISTSDFHFGTSDVLEKVIDNKNDDGTEKKQTSTLSNKETNNANNNENETDKGQNETEKKNEQNETQNKTDEEKSRKPAYDKNKSFFDNITTDADVKKQQKQENLEGQRIHDIETFGSVAETYRSRHGMNQQNNQNRNYNRSNNQRNFNQRRNNQQQNYNDNYRRYENNQFDANNQKWVQKRTN